MRWGGEGAPLSFEICRAQRDVLLGADPGVTLSRRASSALAEVREELQHRVTTNGTVVERSRGEATWWTWAGTRANATLMAALPGVVDPKQRLGNFGLRLLREDAASDLAGMLGDVDWETALPEVNPAAVTRLKFSEALPPDLAARTVARRMADPVGAGATAAEPRSEVVIQRQRC